MSRAGDFLRGFTFGFLVTLAALLGLVLP